MMKEGSPIINKNLQIPHLVHPHSILEQVSLVIIVYPINLNHRQKHSGSIEIIFAPHQLWWDWFDHPLEVRILLLCGGWVVVQVDQFGQLSDYWPCSNVVCLKAFFYFYKFKVYPERFHARDAEVKVAVSAASSEVFLTSPR